MGIKSRKVIRARMKNRWVKLNLDSIWESLKNIYVATGKKDVNLALMNVRDFHKDNENLQREAGFIGKLIQLEASGYVDPPINIGKLYQEVVRCVNLRERNTP